MISAKTLPAAITLTVVDADGSARQFHLKPEHSVFLGTSNNCGLPLSGEGVSDIHCYVKFEDGELWIEDWMSKSGTLVNGQPITGRLALNLDDVVQVGQNKVTLQDAVQIIPSPLPRPATTHAVDVLPASRPSDDGASADHGDIRYASPPAEEINDVTHGHSADQTGFDSSLFEIDDEAICDRETVALLRAEIMQLQAELAQRDANAFDEGIERVAASPGAEETERVHERMQELIDEANRSDERVSLLEEMLLAAEDAIRSEQEERAQLEAWVDDIEQRVGQREDEHQAEVNLLRQRLKDSQDAQGRLTQQLRHVTSQTPAPNHDHERLEELQRSHQNMEDELAESRKLCASLQQRLIQISEQPERLLREERAKIAQEHAAVARLRLEVSSKLADCEAKRKSGGDTEADLRIKALRDHLREIHDQDKSNAKSASLTLRLARLWQRVQA